MFKDISFNTQHSSVKQEKKEKKKTKQAIF